MINSIECLASTESQSSIDFALVHNELGPILDVAKYPSANQLMRIASREVDFDVTACGIRAQDELERQGVISGVEFNAEYRQKIKEDYPKEFDPKKKIESPLHYTKRHSLDGGRRKKLKEYYNAQAKSSGEELSQRIANDEGNLQFIHPVSTDVLEDTIREIVGETNNGIVEYVELIKSLVPEPVEPKLGSIAIFRMFRKPKEEQPNPQITEAIKELTSVMESAQIGTPAFAAIAANRHVEEYKKGVRSQLEQKYDQFTAESIAGLESTLIIGYESISRHQASPKTKKSEDLITPEKIIEPLKSKEETQESEQLKELKEVSIGRVLNPFPWIKNGAPKFYKVTNGDETIVYCKGFTSMKNRAISRKIRSQSRAANKFSSIVQKIKQVELEGNSMNHPQISSVKYANFNDLTIRYFKNFSAHAGRAYYTVANVGRFKSVKKLAEKHDISPETPLVILLAETDKSNQPKVYADFGMAGRVGKSRLSG